jgi:CRISPR type I-D-associated protein Csc2
VSPNWTKQVVTIVGVKTAVSRFLPVSHEGHSNETYVDKVENLGERSRAEFLTRKMKGIERRMHIALFRELATTIDNGWEQFFRKYFNNTICVIPDGLCVACWNCSLFGALDARGQMATFTRIRYFDSYSLEAVEDCVGSMDNEEMGIGNQVYEDLTADKKGKLRRRSAETYHLYEYVKAGTRFPFITMIESPTRLDVASMLHAIRRADLHGYGKYNANHGKFSTEFLAVATGYPRFSVLNMLADMEAGKEINLTFDGLAGGHSPVVLQEKEGIEELAGTLENEFAQYVEALG